MAHAPFLMSGPRALEFFVQASYTAQSPWEFYTSFSPYCVGLALRHLSLCGVVWDDEFQYLRDIATAPRGTIRFMDIKYVLAFLERADALAESDIALKEPVSSMLQEIRDQIERTRMAPNQIIIFSHEVAIVVLHGQPPMVDECTEAAHVISGRTTHNGSEEKVRLIFKEGVSPMQHVMASCSSAVQCCITAFGVAHLFYRKAAKGKAIFWPNNVQHCADANGLAADYAGWEWQTKTPKSVLSNNITDQRLSSSRGSKFIPLKLITGLEEGLQIARTSALKDLKWEFSEGESRLTMSEPKSLRSIFEANRVRRFTRTPTMALRTARQTAMEHSAVFIAGDDYPYPDELSGV